MQVTMLPIEQIDVGTRLRVVDPDWVQGLRLSIGQIGLQTPITVGPANAKGQHKLIAGAHRLAACSDMGHATIAAVVCRLNVLAQRLVEIDENLCRRDLSALDRAAFLHERKLVYEEVHPNTKNGRKGLQEMWNIRGLASEEQNVRLMDDAPAFGDIAAQKMGFTPQHIRRFLKLWGALAPDVRPVLANSLYADKFSELRLLSSQQPAMQRKIVTALLRPEKPARSVRAALAEVSDKVAPPLSASEKKLAALCAAWRRCDKRNQRKFLTHLYETEPENLAALLPGGLLAAVESIPADRPALRIIEGGAS